MQGISKLHAYYCRAFVVHELPSSLKPIGAEAFGEAAKAFIEAFNRLFVSEQPSKKEAEVKN